jgi:hypothetical protein
MATTEVTRKRIKVVGTPIAFSKLEESTPFSLTISASDSGSYEQTSLYSECLKLRMENVKLEAQNKCLRAKVIAMQATNSAERCLEIREIQREQAKEEVQTYFKEHHGETIYPSDIMEALSLDYELVYEICEELEREGMVKGL